MSRAYTEDRLCIESAYSVTKNQIFLDDHFYGLLQNSSGLNPEFRGIYEHVLYSVCSPRHIAKYTYTIQRKLMQGEQI